MTTRLVDLEDERRVRHDAGRSIGLFCRELPAAVSRDVIAQLQRLHMEHGKNVRLCLHSSPEDSFHSMIICEQRGGYYPPHKHAGKGECFHILSGELAIAIFDEAGAILDACRLSPDDIFLYRVAVGSIHMVIPLSEFVVYHESKPGPFLGDADSILPDWAPDSNDLDQIATLVARTMQWLETA